MNDRTLMFKNISCNIKVFVYNNRECMGYPLTNNESFVLKYLINSIPYIVEHTIPDVRVIVLSSVAWIIRGQ